jgi:hypothetical protein
MRLAALGIDKVFGVPGDYAFSVNDAVETIGGLEWVACANELNAAYAADGYDKALEDIEDHDGAAYIEVMIPGEESQPLPEDVVDRGYKLRTPGA